jgi:Preprotein translocase subunit SecA (ATPase, RNA helicase)
MITANIIKMLKFVNKLFGSSSKNKLKSYYKTIEAINGLEKEISLLSDEDLQKKTSFYKEKINKGSTLNQIS